MVIGESLGPAYRDRNGQIPGYPMLVTQQYFKSRMSVQMLLWLSLIFIVHKRLKVLFTALCLGLPPLLGLFMRGYYG